MLFFEIHSILINYLVFLADRSVERGTDKTSEIPDGVPGGLRRGDGEASSSHLATVGKLRRGPPLSRISLTLDS